MNYDSEKSRLLIRQTNLAGRAATLAEVTLANQLQSADDAVTILARELDAAQKTHVIDMMELRALEEAKGASKNAAKIIEAGEKDRRELCARIAELESKLLGATR